MTTKATKAEQPKKEKRQNRLKVLREQSKLTLVEVGKLVDLDMSTVSRHESGDRGMTAEEIAKYAKVFKVDKLAIFMDPSEFEAEPTTK